MDKGITNQKSTEYERLKDLHPACAPADDGRGGCKRKSIYLSPRKEMNGIPFLLRCLVIQTMSIGARETQSLEMSDI